MRIQIKAAMNFPLVGLALFEFCYAPEILLVSLSSEVIVRFILSIINILKAEMTHLTKIDIVFSHVFKIG